MLTVKSPHISLIVVDLCWFSSTCSGITAGLFIKLLGLGGSEVPRRNDVPIFRKHRKANSRQFTESHANRLT